ncbi:MAG: glycosyltransferase family 9 protein [Calditrichaeota bacterium]|nr:glycosyltransferase family 9 protein [Calditrichota bacterium]MBT7788014.1 glycosyltransferase family 9 protein [Calditrichota bacterium]
MTMKGDVLVVRNDRLGDTVLSLPVIPFLQEKYPNSKIHFLADPSVAPLIRCVEGIESVLSASDRNKDKSLDQIRHLQITSAYCLRPTFQNALALKQAKVPNRYGTSRRWYSWLFNHRISIRRRGMNLHEADLNLDLVTFPETNRQVPFPKFNIPEADRQFARTLIKSLNIDTRSEIVVVHPGSGNSARNWPAEYFRQLATLLSEQGGVKLIITGIPSESELCRSVADSTHVNLCGKSSLTQLAALLLESSLFIGNSTGPLHLASALGIPVTGLYPPVKDCLPVRWGPYNHPEMTITPDLPICSKCRPGEFSECFCMEQIAPEDVFQKCLDALRGSKR